MFPASKIIGYWYAYGDPEGYVQCIPASLAAFLLRSSLDALAPVPRSNQTKAGTSHLALPAPR